MRRPGWRAELAAWVDGWRALPDNPLAGMLRVMEARRRRLPFWRRHSFTVAVAAIMLATTAFYVYAELQFTALGYTKPSTMVLASLAMLVLPVYAAWAVQGLFTAVVDAFSLLARPDRRAGRFTLDDLAAITPLSDRDIVLGALRVLLPPLYLRVLIGAALLCVVMPVASWEISGGLMMQRPGLASGMAGLVKGANVLGDLWLVFTALPGWLRGLMVSPLSFATVALSGCLAATAGMLYVLALGRGLSAGLGAITAMGMVIGQFLCGIGATGIAVVLPQTYESARGMPLASMLVAAAFFLAWLASMLLSARHVPLFRAGVAMGTPLLAIMSIIAYSLLAWQVLGEGDATASAALNYTWAWTSLLGLSPVAVLSPALWGIEQAQYGLEPGWWLGTPWWEWLRYPLLLAVQLLLIAALAGYAEESVRLRRRGEG